MLTRADADILRRYPHKALHALADRIEAALTPGERRRVWRWAERGEYIHAGALEGHRFRTRCGMLLPETGTSLVPPPRRHEHLCRLCLAVVPRP